MQHVRAEIAFDVGCSLGEGPVWWDDRLWFVDIEGRVLHCFDPASGGSTAYPVPGRIGFAVPASRGRWLIGQDASIACFVPGEGEPSHLAQVEPPDRDTRMNDGKCDPRGRLLAGTMHMGVSLPVGALYRFASDGRPTQVVAGATISNGLAWDEQRSVMYYIDTPTRRIDAFEWCADSGDITGRRSVAQIAVGSPDGMCIDREGMLWVALWGGSRVARIDPQSGREIGGVALPCAHVTSCCFGGERLDQLWITTARVGLTAESIREQPLSGGLFVADVGAQGWPTTPARVPNAVI